METSDRYIDKNWDSFCPDSKTKTLQGCEFREMILLSFLLLATGYSATINKYTLPNLPAQCTNIDRDMAYSTTFRNFGNSGKALVRTLIGATDGNTIGCESYVIIGFDAEVDEVTHTFLPIKSVKRLDKHLSICSESDDGCNGTFWRIEFDNTQTWFTGSTFQQLEFEIAYKNDIPIAAMQYNCNFGRSCGAAQSGQT